MLAAFPPDLGRYLGEADVGADPEVLRACLSDKGIAEILAVRRRWDPLRRLTSILDRPIPAQGEGTLR